VGKKNTTSKFTAALIVCLVSVVDAYILIWSVDGEFMDEDSSWGTKSLRSSASKQDLLAHG
jgi:hypothetical protein